MGMVVQLARWRCSTGWRRGTICGLRRRRIEITLLHNFVWHLHYTWRDRRDGSAVLRQLVRFHLSNGLVSMVGNLALMRVLVHGAGLPVLVANGIAILCCSVANFCLGDWLGVCGREVSGSAPRGVLLSGLFSYMDR